MPQRASQASRDLIPTQLKPQDVAITLKIVLFEIRNPGDCGGRPGAGWTLAEIAKETHLSVSEVHYAVRRLVETGLLRAVDRRVNRYAIEELLVHGIRYVFPPARGRVTRGVPTAYAAPPLKDIVHSSGDPVPVWPFAGGTVRGVAFSPLYPGAVLASQDDAEFYELLALTDALRGDARARERAAATDLLHSRLLDGAGTSHDARRSGAATVSTSAPHGGGIDE